MMFQVSRVLAAVLTAAAMTAAVPFSAYAGVVDGMHAADPSQFTEEEGIGPGTAGRLGLKSVSCPKGLEQDLWDEALMNLERCGDAAKRDLEMVNAVRAAAGKPALSLDQTLCMAAAYRAAQMRKYRHLSHYSPDGAFLAYETARTIFADDSVYVYENFYYEYDDLARLPLEPAARQELFLGDLSAMTEDGQAWLTASSSHYANQIADGITQIGVGYAFSPENEPMLDTMIQLFR